MLDISLCYIEKQDSTFDIRAAITTTTITTTTTTTVTVYVQRTLDLSRRFIEKSDGTFDFCERSVSAGWSLQDQCFAGKQPIRLAELKTFLKIGVCWL